MIERLLEYFGLTTLKKTEDEIRSLYNEIKEREIEREDKIRHEQICLYYLKFKRIVDIYYDSGEKELAKILLKDLNDFIKIGKIVYYKDISIYANIYMTIIQAHTELYVSTKNRGSE